MTLIERLRAENTWFSNHILGTEAADLLESQAARIAELEAEAIDARRVLRQSEEVIRALHREATEYKTELTALRRKIDEAPVVAWCVAYDTIHGTRIHSDPLRYAPAVDAHVKRCGGRASKVALISKEDLA